jgi:hypothetical protein
MKNNFEKISVICALFIGNRAVQVDNIIENKLYYFQKQLEYLEKYKNKIFKFYFVVTFENENYFEKYKDILNHYNNEIINISFKQNLGGSYTSWKFGLELDNGESDLVFLIEDDYVIYDAKSIDNIVSDFEIDNELFYYCGEWSTIPMEIKNTYIIAHAAISNGIINNKMYHLSQYKFHTVDEITRKDLFLNQITFLEPFRLNRYKIKDYKSKYSSMFSHGVNQIEEKGIVKSDIIFYPLTIIN